MRIVLVRHAKVRINIDTPIPASHMRAWVATYDRAPIDSAPPPQKVISLAKEAEVIITSALPRSIASAKLLGVAPHASDALFNEADVPHAALPLLKLRPKTWLVILRLLMVARLGRFNDSFTQSKMRAHKGAQKIEAYAKRHGNVMLVAHGGMNWLLGKALQKRGWEQIEHSGSGHWGVGIYEKDER